MRLPTIQAVDRAMTRFGGRLRYGLRFVTPPAVFFCVLSHVSERNRWVLAHSFGFTADESRYFYLKAMEFSGWLDALGLTMCLVAAMCTIDPKVRRERPLIRHIVVLSVVFFALLMVPTIQ